MGKASLVQQSGKLHADLTGEADCQRERCLTGRKCCTILPNAGAAASNDLRPVSSYSLADVVSVALHLLFDHGYSKMRDCRGCPSIGLPLGNVDEVVFETLSP